MTLTIVSKILTLILSFILIGCSYWPPELLSRLVIPTSSGPQTFNSPLNNSAYSVFGYIYEGLLNQNPITQELEPALAEKWDQSPDGKQIIFTLKKNLKWSDGQPLTANDVVFSYNQIYLNDKILTSYKDILKVGISRQFPTVKKLDDRRIEFTIPETFAPFLLYAGGIYILPAHALEESTKTFDSKGNPLFMTKWGTDTNPSSIIVNGMYQIKSYRPNQRVLLEKNPYYWRKDSQGTPQPYIPEIVWQIIENTDTQFLNFRSGNLDTLDIAPEAYPLLKREEKKGNYTIYNGGPDPGTTFLAFNQNQGRNAKNEPLVDPIKLAWFTNQTFRQAIAYAIDRETMKQNIYRGLGELQHSSFPVQSPYYLSPQQGLPIYLYNPDKAKQLLLQTGFKYNSQNQLEDNQGNQVRFTILAAAGKKVRELMANQIKQDLEKIGIKIDLEYLSFNTYIEKVSGLRNWDTYLGGFTGGGSEPHSGYNVWSSTGRLHTFNLGSQPGAPPIKNWVVTPWEQEIDRLYIAGSKELNPTKRKEIYHQVQKIAQEQLPYIYMVNPLSFSAVRNRITGIKFNALGGPFWNLHELQITP